MDKKKDEITLKEFVVTIKSWISYLLSKWKLIIIVGIIGGLCGLGFSITRKPEYTATLTFIVDESQSVDLGNAIGIANMLGFDLGGGGGIFSGNNLIQLFKSRSMVEKTLLSPVNINGQTISFAEFYIQSLNLRNGWTENEQLKNIQFLPNNNSSKSNRQQDSVMGAIYSIIVNNNLSVEQKDKRIDIISIDMKFVNEQFAKTFTEALVKEVSDFYINSKNQKARLNLDILEHQTDSVRAELNRAISGVATATDNTFNLNPALNVARVPSTKRQVDVQANSNILIELIKQTELAKIIVRKSTPLIQVIDQPILPLKKEKLGKLKGMIIGGIIGGLLIVLVLSAIRLIKKLNRL